MPPHVFKNGCASSYMAPVIQEWLAEHFINHVTINVRHNLVTHVLVLIMNQLDYSEVWTSRKRRNDYTLLRTI